MTKHGYTFVRGDYSEDYFFMLSTRYALCGGFVYGMLKLSGHELPMSTLPPKIRVTISLKPLKIKGARKIYINLVRGPHTDGVWQFARIPKTWPRGNDNNGMFEKSYMTLRDFFIANKLNLANKHAIWVHVAEA